MNIFEYFSPDTCNPMWRNNGLESWSKQEVIDKIDKINKIWDGKLVLVDMINYPIPEYNSVPISNEMFEGWSYPEWTIFVLYCHSWGSSWYVQKQLAPKFPKYKFVNLAWGIGMWNLT